MLSLVHAVIVMLAPFTLEVAADLLWVIRIHNIPVHVHVRPQSLPARFHMLSRADMAQCDLLIIIGTSLQVCRPPLRPCVSPSLYSVSFLRTFLYNSRIFNRCIFAHLSEPLMDTVGDRA